MDGTTRFGTAGGHAGTADDAGDGGDALFTPPSSPSSVPQQGRVLVDSGWNEGESEGETHTPAHTPEWTNPNEGDPGTTPIVGAFHGADDIWL